ncbi:MAG: Fic family protein [Rickettsiales bacterium]|nr:Fic family protein [Rickettsiales bacterium]
MCQHPMHPALEALKTIEHHFYQQNAAVRSQCTTITVFNHIIQWLNRIPINADYYQLYIENYLLKKQLAIATPSDPYIIKKSRQNIEGYNNARAYLMDKADSDEAFTADDLVKSYSLLMGQSYHALSEILSNHQMRVFTLDKTASLYEGAEPSDYALCLDYLITVINQPHYSLDAPVHACLVHYMTVIIHCFPDGNGRMGRLLSSYILRRAGYRLNHRSLEKYYVVDKIGYEAYMGAHGNFYQLTITPQTIKDNLTFFLNAISEAYMLKVRATTSAIAARVKTMLRGKAAVIKAVYPIPANLTPVIQDKYIKAHGTVQGMWPYHDAKGQLFAWSVRFSNDVSKNYFFFQLFEHGKWERNDIYYRMKMPLYRLHTMHDKPNPIYLLVEGEKCAETAAALLKDTNFIPLTWALGSFLISETDWSPLQKAGTQLYIWRDNDLIGKEGEQKICDFLYPTGCHIKCLDDAAFTGKPEKWDIADAVEDGMTTSECLEFIERYMVDYQPR